ncbi:carbohydrate binding domain-containing protein [Shewanella algae]|uniref:carbohydrate binding domain-containing protein n=1 Tax=Shewanella algae TaxID=38313 RepID=UPI001AAF8947|nr:carbohydrate binding domain-containing protein [Shewanella algae]MBO2698100.1 carbohydrate binding domain-containing protein [Shewanella algae]
MPRLIPQKLTKLQNQAYIGLDGEFVTVIGVGFAIHDGVTPGGTIYEQQKLISGRNLLRNGDFAVQQNGNQWLGVPTIGDAAYVADGWFFQRGGGSVANVSVSENYLDSNLKIHRSLRVTTTTGGGSNAFSVFSQRKAGALLFSGKTLTLSFWAKCNTARSIALEAGNDFKSATANQRIAIGKADLTTQWKYFSFTFKFPDRPLTFTRGADHHVWLYFWLEAGDDYNSRTGGINTYSGSFDIADIQLEEGEISTPYDRLEFQQSRAKVREYFESVTSVISLSKYGDSLTDSKVGGYIPFGVNKRKAPTVTATYDFLSGGSLFGISEDGFNVSGTANSNSSVARVLSYTADAEIQP